MVAYCIFNGSGGFTRKITWNALKVVMMDNKFAIRQNSDAHANS